jgi:uncharacterized damage-inducible protein DinB
VEIADVFVDAFTRLKEAVHATLEGLDEEQLAFRADGEANSIAWLLWHLTRVEDDHVCDVAGVEQAWTAGGWFDRFGLPFDRGAHGYGHTSDEVAQVRASADLLSGYHDAVSAATIDYVKGLRAADLDRVVDRRWDPPVTLGVRLVSVVEDEFQHIGQAGFVRGLVERGAKSS